MDKSKVEPLPVFLAGLHQQNLDIGNGWMILNSTLAMWIMNDLYFKITSDESVKKLGQLDKEKKDYYIQAAREYYDTDLLVAQACRVAYVIELINMTVDVPRGGI